ncbi:hypothetical protein CR513_25995, partial [Mucuna pruriens]
MTRALRIQSTTILDLYLLDRRDALLKHRAPLREWNEDIPTVSKRPNCFASRHPRTTQTTNQPVKCFKCNGPHLTRECPIRGIVCFKCQNPRHMARDFQGSTKSEPMVDVVKATKPTTTGKVFAISKAKASRFENLVLGATHSFILMIVHKMLIFPNPKDTGFIIANQANVALDEGAKGYVILSFIEVMGTFQLEFVEVVKDFAKVFPEEVPNLPPPRDVEFAIDLIPRVGHVSIAPYKMALAKKVQGEDQQELVILKGKGKALEGYTLHYVISSHFLFDDKKGRIWKRKL